MEPFSNSEKTSQVSRLSSYAHAFDARNERMASVFKHLPGDYKLSALPIPVAADYG